MCLKFSQRIYQQCIHTYSQPSRKYKKKIKRFTNNSFRHGKNVECVKSTFTASVSDALTNFEIENPSKATTTLMWGSYQSTTTLKFAYFTLESNYNVYQCLDVYVCLCI